MRLSTVCEIIESTRSNVGGGRGYFAFAPHALFAPTVVDGPPPPSAGKSDDAAMGATAAAEGARAETPAAVATAAAASEDDIGLGEAIGAGVTAVGGTAAVGVAAAVVKEDGAATLMPHRAGPSEPLGFIGMCWAVGKAWEADGSAGGSTPASGCGCSDVEPCGRGGAATAIDAGVWLG